MGLLAAAGLIEEQGDTDQPSTDCNLTLLGTAAAAASVDNDASES